MKVKFALVFSAVCLLCSCGSDNKVPNTVEVAQTQTTVSDIERTTAPTTVSTEEQTTAPATTSAPAPPEDLIWKTVCSSLENWQYSLPYQH